MGIWTAVPIIGKVLEKAGEIIDKAIPDKDLRERLKHDLENSITKRDHDEIMALVDARAKIILAEASGHSWLQRNWRPLLMLVIVAIVANNYIIYPYLALFGVPTVSLELPEKLWNLMTVGVGGYVVGRSAEQAVRAWKNGR
jgi:hypothetical protein